MTTDCTLEYDEIQDRLAGLTRPGARVVAQVTEGAYSRARRWVVAWPNGERAFVKAGNYPDPTHGLHLEAIVGRAVDSVHVPRLLAWDAGDAAQGVPSLLVLEDLSGARWRTPVTQADAGMLREALDALADLDAPGELPTLDASWDHLRHAWSAFAGERRADLLATGLVDEAWVDRHAEWLTGLERDASLTGSQLVHGDLWMQNWCRVDGRGAVLVDWSGACRGNARINHAWGECAVRAAGGPPGIVMDPGADDAPAWAAWMCGRALDFAVDVAGDDRARLVETVRREAAAAIDWACEACDLPRPRTAERARVDPAWRP